MQVDTASCRCATAKTTTIIVDQPSFFNTRRVPLTFRRLKVAKRRGKEARMKKDGPTRESDRRMLTLAPRCINIRDRVGFLSGPNLKCDVRYGRVNTRGASPWIDVSRIDGTSKTCEDLGMEGSSMIKRRE